MGFYVEMEPLVLELSAVDNFIHYHLFSVTDDVKL